MIDLNAVEKFGEIDSEGMLEHVLNLPQTCADAWELGQETYPQLEVATRFEQVKRIVVVGMGGSAIGGDLLAALVAQECPYPIFTHRGYELPAFAHGPETLVIGSSHSGNTEETLSAFTQAHERGTALLAVTTGGKMARLAAQWDVPLIRFSYESQPRAALGYSLILLLNLLVQLDLVSDKADELVQAVTVMQDWQGEIGPEVPLASNPAKRLAGQLMERMPVVYGAGLIKPVAHRWKTQFNENAKVWCFFEEMPELNHNAVVGYQMSERIRDRAVVIFVRSPSDSDRINARWRVTRRMLLHEGIGHDEVRARGESRLAQMLSAIHFGDLVSVYLAIASGVDPTPVKPIAYLKEELSKV